MRRRVVVTGMGVVSPIGCAIGEFRERLFAGDSGAGPVTLFDASGLPTRIAAEVKRPFPEFRDRKISFALEAARQAMDAVGLRGTGGSLSLGLGLELFSMDDMAELRRTGHAPDSASERLTFLQTPSDLCVPRIAWRYGFDRPPLVHVSACAAGTDAIGAGFRLVASGRRDLVLAGGTDSMINPLGLGGFCKIGATSTRNAEPTRASRPFDRDRDGFVLGEGAGMLVLEPLESARRRGVRIHAEVCGYGCSFDAAGISEPHPEGRGAFQAMTRALEDARIRPDRIDCVNAHGTSTPKNDPVETMALERLLGARAKCVPVVSTKSMIGHLISAAGAVEAIAAILCMEADVVHPTMNLDNPDPACGLDYVPGTSRRHRQEYVLSNSFGFGGQNACIVLRNGRDARDAQR